jgi:hypothetical protein
LQRGTDSITVWASLKLPPQDLQNLLLSGMSSLHCAQYFTLDPSVVEVARPLKREQDYLSTENGETSFTLITFHIIDCPCTAP